METQERTSIIRAKKHQLEQIWDLENRIFADDDRFSKTRLRYLLNSPNAAFFLGLKGNVPIAYGIALKNRLRSGKTKGRIYSIGVLREFRTRGVGTKLLDSLEHWLSLEGAIFITLETKIKKNGARDFFARRGYEVTEFLPKYYASTDGIRMKKAKTVVPRLKSTRQPRYSDRV